MTEAAERPAPRSRRNWDSDHTPRSGLKTHYHPGW